MVELPVSNNPLMREIDSIVGDCGLSQRVGRLVSRDLVAGKEARPPTSDVGWWKLMAMETHDDGATCLPRSRCFSPPISIEIELYLHSQHASQAKCMS